MLLLESLTRTPAQDLARMAQSHSMAGEPLAPQPDAIAERLLDSTYLQALLQGLADEEWSALKVVFFNGGDQGITVELCHQIVGMLSGRQRKRSIQALEHLVSQGLIYLRAQNYRQVFFIPTDLMAVMGEILHQQLRVRFGLAEAPVRFGHGGRYLLEELHRFLAYLHTHEVTLTQQGQIFKRHLRALLDLLMADGEEAESVIGRYPEPLGLLMGYGLDRHLIRREEGRLLTTEQLDAWLQRPEGEKLLDLFQYWQDRYYYQDLQTFLQVLRSVDQGWISVDRLAEELEPLINPSQRGSFLLRLRHHLTTFLEPLNLFELGQVVAGERCGAAVPELACRLTEAGVALLAGKAAPEAPSPGAPLLLQPTFEIIAPRPVPSQLLWLLELVADLIGQTDRTLTYRLSRNSVYRALKTGMSGPDLIQSLANYSVTGVPQNVAFDLTAWSQTYGQLYLQEVMLLRCADPVLAAQVQASRRTGRYILGQLSPTDLIVDAPRYKELLEALEADGLMPRPEVERPGS